MVRLRAARQGRVLHLDEIADVHVFAQRCARAQPRERADERTRAHAHAQGLAVDVGERVDHRAGGDHRVAHQAVRPDANPVAELHMAFEDAVDVDLHVGAAAQFATHVQAPRVGQANPGVHQRGGLGALEAALEVGELHGAVHTQHFGVARRCGGGDGHALGDRHRDDVGQVVLALGVVAGQRGEPAFEVRGGRGHHAGVDLVDVALHRRRILVLDDAVNPAALVRRTAGRVATHDPAVAGRVVEGDRQQREPGARARGDQRPRRGGLDQRHVAVEDQRRAAVVQQRCGLQRGVAGAQLRRLAHEAKVGRLNRCFDRFGTVAGDDDNAVRPEAGGGFENMLQ